MIINSVPTAAIATTVWTAAGRTLTADPATDAGAATFVWTHAARTLTADPATDAGAATFVWTHAARTLTADPATDAGAATFVWTHAARTLTADPATDAGAATFVWTHAARTLTADPATDAGAATFVWTHAARTLTDYGLPTTSESSGTGFTVVASGNNAKGAWVQLIASTSAAAKGVIITMSETGSQAFSVDIGAGGVGSEVVAIADLHIVQSSNVGDNSVMVIVPIKIATATRISARAFCATTQSLSVAITILE